MGDRILKDFQSQKMKKESIKDPMLLADPPACDKKVLPISLSEEEKAKL